MTRSQSGAVETHPPKSRPKRALYRWGGNEGGAATRRPRGGRLGDQLRDCPEKRPLPKQEVTWTDLARARCFCPTTWNDRSTENPAPMKEDMPWNRCC
jgi:hypothetical protein